MNTLQFPQKNATLCSTSKIMLAIQMTKMYRNLKLSIHIVY